MKPIIIQRPLRELRKCDMCKQYPKRTTDQYWNFTSAISKTELIICNKCKKRENDELPKYEKKS